MTDVIDINDFLRRESKIRLQTLFEGDMPIVCTMALISAFDPKATDLENKVADQTFKEALNKACYYGFPIKGPVNGSGGGHDITITIHNPFFDLAHRVCGCGPIRRLG